jgi:hypothetical protein
MNLETTKWPPTKHDLARLHLKHTNREIASMYGVSHSTVQRQLEAYGIYKIFIQERIRLKRRSDFSLWEWDPTNQATPTWLDGEGKPMVLTKYKDRLHSMPTFRAMAQYRLGRIIPRFLVVHHVCENIRCLNPDHGVIVMKYRQSHYRSDYGDLYPCFDLSGYDTKRYGSKCIEGNIPSITTLNISAADWEQFLVHAIMPDRA